MEGVYKSGAFEHEKCPKSKVRDEKVAGETRRAQVITDGGTDGAGWAGAVREPSSPLGRGERNNASTGFFSFSKRRKAVNCGCPGKDKCKVCVFHFRLCL